MHTSSAHDAFEELLDPKFEIVPGVYFLPHDAGIDMDKLGATYVPSYEWRGPGSWHPNDMCLVVMSTSQGPFPMETMYSWDDTSSGGTRMTLRNRGEPAGFSKLVAPMMASAMRRANRKDLARLKSVLEQSS